MVTVPGRLDTENAPFTLSLHNPHMNVPSRAAHIAFALSARCSSRECQHRHSISPIPLAPPPQPLLHKLTARLPAECTCSRQSRCYTCRQHDTSMTISHTGVANNNSPSGQISRQYSQLCILSASWMDNHVPFHSPVGRAVVIGILRPRVGGRRRVDTEPVGPRVLR